MASSAVVFTKQSLAVRQVPRITELGLLVRCPLAVILTNEQSVSALITYHKSCVTQEQFCVFHYFFLKLAHINLLLIYRRQLCLINVSEMGTDGKIRKDFQRGFQQLILCVCGVLFNLLTFFKEQCAVFRDLTLINYLQSEKVVGLTMLFYIS